MPRPKYRLTGVYRFSPRLQAGLEYNPSAGEVSLIGNYILATESEKWPMINFGTSSDRIGTPPGPHAYYVTFAKSLSRLKMGPYVSINYSEFEQRINFPFGVNYSITPGLSAMFMNDARKSHLLMTYSKETWSVTGLLVWMKHPGISFSWGF